MMRLPYHRLFGMMLIALTASAAALGVEDEPAGTLLASKRSKIYHTQTCSAVKQLNTETALRFKTEEEAQASGRRLCRVCADMVARGAKAAPVEKAPAGVKPVEPVGGSGPSIAPMSASQPARTSVAAPSTATIKKVLPGGTLVSDTDETFGLIGVLCPQEGQPLSRDAVRFIREQTRGRKVRLRTEPGGGRRDALGRLQVYLFAQPGDRDLGEELVFQGLAWVDRTSSFDRYARYDEQEDHAAWKHRGIWKAHEGPEGSAAVLIGRHALHYHAPGCSHAAQLTDAQTVTLNIAKARRLTPCEHYREPTGSQTAAKSNE